MVFPTGELLVVTIGYIISVVTGAAFGIFVLAQGRKTHQLFFFLTCCAMTGFALQFVIGINLPPSPLAYQVWFANIVDAFIPMFYFHFTVAAMDAWKRWRDFVIANYIVGSAIVVAAFLYPALFLPEIVPKLYFKSYLVGGPLYVAMFAFFWLSFAVSMGVLLVERRYHGEEGKRRISYYLLSPICGFLTGATAFLLVFDIKLDPIMSMFVGIFIIPIVYGMIKKDLLDIRIVFRRTLFFTLAIAGTAGILVAISLLSELLAPLIPGFFYVVPLLAALAAVAVGALYWQKAQEAEKLKYEFLTVVAHKFRTPLTRIRWSVDALLAQPELNDEARTLITHVSESDLELIQLANLLMNAAEGKSAYGFGPKEVALAPLIEKALAASASALKDKGITATSSLGPSLPPVLGDADRLASVISVLLENAIAYTPRGGSISLTLTGSAEELRFEISDTGMGVAPDEQNLIFKKFFRTDRARSADTEGVGIGLSTAKAIIERARGSIGVRSAGIGQGSTFWFTLPAVKK